VLTLCGLSIVALAITLLARLLRGSALPVGGALAVGLAVMAGMRGDAAGSAVIWAATAVCGYVALNGVVSRFTGTRLISEMAEKMAFVLVPPVLLIFLVLGTIFLGVATPVEAGAMGAVGSVVLAAIKRLVEKRSDRLNAALLTQATNETAKLASFILFILIGARVFALTFFGINGHLWVEELLVSLPGGQMGFMIFTVAIIFFLGCFLDFFEIAFIAIPLLLVPALTLGIDPLWLGVVIALTLQTSFLTPPLGFALFFLRSVAPDAPYRDATTGTTVEGVTTRQIYMGGIPFILVQLALVVLVLAMPDVFINVGPTGPVMDEAEALRSLDSLTIDVPGADIGAPVIEIVPPGN
jgi:TRAP-type mannitol/chloroaromatic compound transport system permease large subunit